ncbi:LacI family DNA-binding transcriptional regulator [Arvimicrobium flavum]|uniref:LacI family DNA-binding transcriptional regulator n=1 Tax=Arvimicrobium flavum TaxID=3393320 RepID=UPI00237C3D15|nr:LacI family DNA-binding transcriptional regulator [Mesorhizobium shangrilense]
MRSTLNDVAREAGVSPATVDRVLNNRTGVRTRTREIVVETARRLGYISPAPDDAGRQPSVPDEVVKLNFALPAGTNTFIKMLHREIEAQALLRPNLDVHVEAIEGFDPDGLARALLDLRGKTQGVGVIALDHPTVREAIRSLAADGVKVVTIASDILHVPRVAYVGIDNRAAGRLAGYLVGRFMRGDASGKAAVFAGSRSYRGHEEREMGFRHILSEAFPRIEVVELREMLDDREKAYSEASALLDRHPDLAAIYNIGAGNPGIARALKERGREHSVVFVGHEATEGTRQLLLDGTLDAVIDQNPRVEAREALNILSQSVRGLPFDPHPPRLAAIFRENIPEA